MTDEEPDGRRGALIAMAVVAAIILGVVLVMQRLHHASEIQDCVASGRTNCAPVPTGR